MKRAIVLAMAVAVAGWWLGCQQKEGGGGSASQGDDKAASPSKAGGTGVKECDDYLATLETCVKNAPAEARAAQEQALKAARDAYSKADVPDSVKASWGASCKQANDMLASTPFCKAGGGGPTTAASAPGAGADTAAATDSAGAGADLFKDPMVAIKALKDKVGGSPVMALELFVYPEWAKMQAQDPKKKENIDEYQFRKGTVEAPVPVKLSGDADQKTLEANLFNLDDVDYTKLPGLIEDAVKRLALEEGKATHVAIKRALPFTPDVRVRIFVNSPRKSGSVEYDAKGTMTKEYK